MMAAGDGFFYFGVVCSGDVEMTKREAYFGR
jgi:hypothetical protein